MAAYWTNHGKADVLSRAVSGGSAAELRAVAVHTAPANAGAAADLNTTSDIVANEVTATNYVRKTLASVTVSEDDTNDWGKLTAAGFTYTAIGGASNDTIVGVWVVRRATSGSDTDASDTLWCYLGLPSSIPTNGGDVVLSFGTNGISTAA